MASNTNSFLIKEYFKLPLFIISGLVKDMKSLSSLKLFLSKEHLYNLIKYCFSNCAQTNQLLVYKTLLEGKLNVEAVIETDYFVQFKFRINKPNTPINYFELIINIHHMGGNKTGFLCGLLIKNAFKEFLQMESLKRQQRISSNNIGHTPIQSKTHRSINLIKCSFDSVKRILLNYKLFHELIPEFCTKVELESENDIVVGDKIKLIYSIPNKPPLVASLVATKVYIGKEELNIILKTEELGKSGTPPQLVEWIAKREHYKSICVILTHTFEIDIPEEFFDQLNEDKVKILNLMKNVLESQEKQKDH